MELDLSLLRAIRLKLGLAILVKGILEGELRLPVLWVENTEILSGVKERTDSNLDYGLACVCRNEAVLDFALLVEIVISQSNYHSLKRCAR